MKKRSLILLVLVLVLISISMLYACNTDSQSAPSQDLGTYYLFDGTKLNPDSFIELRSGNVWYDGESEGKFTLKDGKITLFDGDDELMSGTLSNGVLKLEFMGMESVFKKGTPGTKVDPNPDNPKRTEYSVRFFLNDGTENSITKETENQLITYTPTRSGYIFNGWWFSSGNTENGAPILTKRWNMEQKVEDDSLVLYAEWVFAPTEDAQLPAPSVSVDEYRYSWDSISGANGYNVILKKGNDVIEEIKSLKSTYWDFKQSNDAGTYTLEIRANGDGIKTINSSYTVKNISHKILGKLSSFSFDKKTATISWGVVEGATSYDVWCDGVCLLEDTTVKTYVLTNIDAGKRRVTIMAKRDGWQTSYNYYDIEKDMLKTPSDVNAIFDYDNMTYTFSWEAVKGIAGSEIVYKIYNGAKLLTQTDKTTYVVQQSEWRESETVKNIQVVSFDTSANTIQSIPSDNVEIKKMVEIEFLSDDAAAGTVEAKRSVNDINITFNYNYRDCPTNIIQVLNKDNPAIEYFTPVRDGYVFLGWYKDKQCTKRFDFSSTVKSDITLFALWQDIDEKTTVLELNKEKKVYTSKTFQKFTFVPMKAGSFTLGYYNNGSGQRTNINVYQGISTVYAPGYQTSKSWVMKTFELNAYDMVTISITSTSDNYSGYFTFKMEGDALPDVNPDSFEQGMTDSRLVAPVGTEIELTANTNLGYTWIGWYNGDVKVSEDKNFSYKFTVPNTDKKFTAKWSKVVLKRNDISAGDIEGIDSAYKVGDTATITATTNSGYTWIGWYDGDKKLTDELTYTFAMPTENKTFTAKWSKVVLKRNDISAGDVRGIDSAYKVGDTATITATTNSGYTWIGWYDGDEKLTDELTYTFAMPAENKTFTAKWVYYTVSTTSNMPEAGTYTIKSQEKVTIGSQSTITAITNNGYTWIGWYDGNKKLTDELTYTFAMPAENKTFTAKWMYYTVSTTSNMPEAGTYTKMDAVKTTVGEVVTLTATGNDGYTWLGWYDKDVRVSDGTSRSYTFTMSNSDKTYTAKWINCPVVLDKNISMAGEVTGLAGESAVGELNTIKSITYKPYTWLGFYDGETLLSEEKEYEFIMSTEPKIITARWTQYYLTIKNGLEEAGEINSNHECVVAFDLNGGDSPGPQRQFVTKTTGLVYPENIPTRNGYIFNGWFSDKECLRLFDFTQPIECSMILYAGWRRINDENGKIIDIVNHNNSDNDYHYVNLAYRSENTYFTTLTTGTYIFYYRAYAAPMNVELYNETMNKSINIMYFQDSYPDGWRWFSFQANGGDVFSIRTLNPHRTIIAIKYYIEGGRLPNAGGCAFISNNPTTIQSGEEITISAQTNDGYTWLGWYDGETKVSEGSSLSYTFKMPCENKTYTAKWSLCPITLEKNMDEAGSIGDVPNRTAVGEEITITASVNKGYTWLGWYDGETKVSEGDSLSYKFVMTSEKRVYTAKYGIIPELSNFYFVYLPKSDSYRICGVRDKNVDTIIVPNSVIEIENGALKGCDNLIEITIPFVGATREETADTYIGYIFGAKKYDDNSKYMPNSLNKIVIENTAKISPNSFYGCTGLTNVIIRDSVTSIGEYAFYGCTALASVTTGNSVTSIGGGAFYGCNKLTNVNYTGNIASWCAISGLENIPRNTGFTLTIDGKEIIGELVIPNSVTSIGRSAFNGCIGLTSVTIGNSVTSIGENAFSGCTGLTSVTIGNSVTSIGGYAFKGCIGLTSITIPNSLTSIGGDAFKGCPIENAKIPAIASEEIKNNKLKNVIITSGNSIRSYAFSGCSSLTNIIIPDSVTSIEENTFYGCTGLTSITIPNSVTSIGRSAFNGCTGLTYVTIGNSVTSIGDYAFYGCKGLTSITIPDGVTSIEERVFYDCKGLTSVTIPDRVTSIDEYAFYGCTRLTSITIPDSVTRIGENAFKGTAYYNNESNWENGVLYIGKHLIAAKDTVSGEYEVKTGTIYISEYAFYDCTNISNVNYTGNIAGWCAISGLENIPRKTGFKLTIAGQEITGELVIPDSVTSIGRSAFKGCIGLTSVAIGNSVTSIGENAFSGCTGLTSVTIGSGVTSIGKDAFSDCTELTSITIPNGVTSIGGHAFSRCSSLTSVTIPDSVTSIGNWAFSSCRGLISITIPSSVTSIGECAFISCTGLTSIAIPNSVTSIGYSAFEGCSFLASVTIPDSVTSIGKNAFYNTAYYNNKNNWGNKVLYIGNHLIQAKSDFSGIQKIKEGIICIANNAFYSCWQLTSITIPDSVVRIGSSAFDGCTGLTSVTIPDSVTSIGYGAFSGCTGLTSIKFNGTIKQWNAIRKDSGWKYNAPSSCKVVCSDGTISI